MVESGGRDSTIKNKKAAKTFAFSDLCSFNGGPIFLLVSWFECDRFDACRDGKRVAQHVGRGRPSAGEKRVRVRMYGRMRHRCFVFPPRNRIELDIQIKKIIHQLFRLFQKSGQLLCSHLMNLPFKSPIECVDCNTTAGSARSCQCSFTAPFCCSVNPETEHSSYVPTLPDMPF